MSKKLDKKKLLKSYKAGLQEWKYLALNDEWSKGYLQAVKDLILDLENGAFDVK